MHVTEVKTKDTPVDQEWNKHNAELQPTDPGTKSTGEFGAKGHVFPPDAQMDSYYFHRSSWEKYIKVIGHMHWLYQ